MSYRIIPTTRFSKEIKRLAKKFPSLKSDFADLIEEITVTHVLEFILAIIASKFAWRLEAKEKGKEEEPE